MVESPVSRHRYLYGNANPVVFEDPSGLLSASRLLAGLALQGTLANVAQTTFTVVDRSLFRENRDGIKFTGEVLTSDAALLSPRNTPLSIFSLPISLSFNLGISTFRADSSPYLYDDGWYEFKDVPIMVVHSRLVVEAATPTPIVPTSMTFGEFELSSSETFGNNPARVLSGGYLASGGSARIAIPSGAFQHAALGAGIQFVRLGLATGNANGIHYGNNIAFGVASDVGLAFPIPFFGDRLRVEPTPSDS
jgi:hypothetical protein